MPGKRSLAVSRQHWKEQARRAERERIIKLLEELDAWPQKFDRDEALEFIIALIKGENK